MAKKLRPKSRIKKLQMIPSDDLIDNPKNWRTHPEHQVSALRASLESLGQIDAAIVIPHPDLPGKFLTVDGHARKGQIAGEVACLVLDLTPAEADQALLSLDPISAMAGTNKQKLDELLASARQTPAEITGMIAEMHRKQEELLAGGGQRATFGGIEIKPVAPDAWNGGSVAAIGPDGEITEHDSTGQTAPGGYLPPAADAGIVAMNEQALFSSSNRWGVPDLIPAMLYDGDLPETTFGNGCTAVPADRAGADRFLFIAGRVPSAKPPGGTLGFYTDDDNFDAAWTNAVEYLEKLRSRQWTAVTSPDFSTWENEPPALRLWAFYRARWVARYWQECGFKVIPSLQTLPSWMGFGPGLGLPRNPPCLAVQLRTGGASKEEDVKNKFEMFVRHVAEAIEDLSPRRVLVYAGSAAKRVLPMLPAGPLYHLVPPHSEVVTAFIKAKKRGGE